jgi:hypothetical protein
MDNVLSINERDSVSFIWSVLRLTNLQEGGPHEIVGRMLSMTTVMNMRSLIGDMKLGLVCGRLRFHEPM